MWFSWRDPVRRLKAAFTLRGYRGGCETAGRRCCGLHEALEYPISETATEAVCSGVESDLRLQTPRVFLKYSQTRNNVSSQRGEPTARSAKVALRGSNAGGGARLGGVSRPRGSRWGCPSASFPPAVAEASSVSSCSAPFDRIAEINFSIDADDDSVSGRLGIRVPAS